MNQNICRGELGLFDEEILLLEKAEAAMQSYSDLIGADIFIDCFYPDRQEGIVMAEAKPAGGLSNYQRSVLFEKAEPEKEPAVFSAREMQMPIRDIKAVTQEQKTVRQDAVPIQTPSGKTIGVLICERDISESVQRDKKYEAAEKKLEAFQGQSVPAHSISAEEVFVKEIRHRIKNNLQMVASILNIQARRSPYPEMQAVLKENVNRILSIAAIYDILAEDTLSDQVSLLEMTERIRRNIEIGVVGPETDIVIEVTGDDITLPSARATSIAIVLNELLTNAVKHAFPGRAGGCITISVKRGLRYSRVTVSDNGNGFKLGGQYASSLGLELVEIIVKERLHGMVHAESDKTGTRMSFDFLAEG